MNQKGLLFTLMTLLLILGIINLNYVVEQGRREEQKIDEIAKLIAVNNKFRQIKGSIVELEKSEKAREQIVRILPFDYVVTDNNVFISQGIPVRESFWDAYSDVLNIYEKFIEYDEFDQGVYDGLKVEVDTVQNDAWGGSDDLNLHYTLDPLCYHYILSHKPHGTQGKTDKVIFNSEHLEKCGSHSFNPNDLNSIEVKIVIKSSDEDLNRVVYTLNDNDPIVCKNPSNCPNETFDGLEENEFYYSVTIDDSLCTNCKFEESSMRTFVGDKVTVTGNKIGIAIDCGGGECISLPIDLNIHDGNLSVSRDVTASIVQIDVNVSFKESASRIRSFYFQDFNFSVSSPDYNIMRSNNPKTIE